MSMPKELYVTVDKNADASEDLMAWRDIARGIEDDGPTTIGIYQLIKIVKRKKVIAEA